MKITSLVKARLQLTSLVFGVLILAALPALNSWGQGSTLGSAAAGSGLLASATMIWDGLLKKHVTVSGGVDYRGLKTDEAELDAFLAANAAIDPKALVAANDAQKKALYINLYNAAMMHNILRYAADEKIDLSSDQFLGILINEISVKGGNIWNGDYKVTLAGNALNLDEIEHQLIRGAVKGDFSAWKVKTLDPRVHAAVNCAALSCPRVRELAYTADNVESMLEANIHEWLSNDDQFQKLDAETLRANSIVFWYYSDFDDYGQNALKNAGAGDYLSQFISPSAKDAAWKVKHLKSNFNDRGTVSLKLSSAFKFAYDWHVNDRRNKK